MPSCNFLAIFGECDEGRWGRHHFLHGPHCTRDENMYAVPSPIKPPTARKPLLLSQHNFFFRIRSLDFPVWPDSLRCETLCRSKVNPVHSLSGPELKAQRTSLKHSMQLTRQLPPVCEPWIYQCGWSPERSSQQSYLLPYDALVATSPSLAEHAQT